MRKTVIIIVVVIVLGGLIGGGYYLGTKKNTNTSSATASTGHSTAPTTQKQVNLSTVMANLQKQFPTITQTYIYTQSQDPNGNLDKPGGYYIAGAEFYDTRTNTPPSSDENSAGNAFGASCGGAIEVYATTANATSRASYLESFQSNPTLNPGAVKQVGVYVLRASENYTASEQAAVLNYLATQVQ